LEVWENTSDGKPQVIAASRWFSPRSWNQEDLCIFIIISL